MKLVLGPGGLGMFSMIGSLKSIEERIDCFDEISGSSAGSMLALFLGVGLSVDTILERCLGVDIRDVVGHFKLKSLLANFGLMSSEKCRDTLVQVCGCDPTFRELKTKIYVAAYCVNRSQTVYFSRDTHPDMHVIDAVCMSISIPLIFASVPYKGDIYIDGCTMEVLPLTPFLMNRSEDVVIICTESMDTAQNELTSVVDYISCLFSKISKFRPDFPQFTQRLSTSIDTYQSINFDMTLEEKLTLYAKGFKEKIIY